MDLARRARHQAGRRLAAAMAALLAAAACTGPGRDEAGDRPSAPPPTVTAAASRSRADAEPRYLEGRLLGRASYAVASLDGRGIWLLEQAGRCTLRKVALDGRVLRPPRRLPCSTGLYARPGWACSPGPRRPATATRAPCWTRGPAGRRPATPSSTGWPATWSFGAATSATPAPSP